MIFENYHNFGKAFDNNNNKNADMTNFQNTEIMDDDFDILHHVLDDQKIMELQNTSINLAINQIENHSCSLNISKDPYFWNNEDVIRWLMHMFNLSQGGLIKCRELDGIKMCSLTNEDFIHIFGNKGELIHSELDIWKEVSSNYFNVAPYNDRHQNPEYNKTYDIYNNYTERGYGQIVYISDNEDSGIEESTIENFDNVNVLSNFSPSANIEHDMELSLNKNTKYFTAQIDNKSSNIRNNDKGAEADQNQLITELLGLPSNFFQTPNTERRKYGKISREKYKTRPQNSHLWYFIKELLEQPQTYGAFLRWLDRDKAIFRIYNSFEVARLWGKRKNRPAMNYDKLSRSLRQYYKKGIMMKTKRSQRLVYQFCGKYAT